MVIGVIQASSQSGKNELIFDSVSKYASDHKVINFGCKPDEETRYSYIEISVLVGLLLSSGSVDLVVTGCSSGQGMMLACNNMPGVLCGYIPTPMDAYLFAQIHNGNAVSLPLGEGYTWNGKENMDQTIERLFSEPWGQGFPKSEAARKLEDTRVLKKIRSDSQVSMPELLRGMDRTLLEKVLCKKDVLDFILSNGKDEALVSLLKDMCGQDTGSRSDR
ncbi:MAG: RpiB/LacA/LacB family sugar-phosphate isomerase [Clostridiales bacterium]|nr:RpiB/LacA/LacB family sugar-phosphate isomerase [Clostridiales bacterium]